MSYVRINVEEVNIYAVSPTVKWTFTNLSDFAYGDKEVCFPSQKTLAKKIGTSIRTIQRHLKELSEVGLIKIIKKKGKNNIYILLSKVKSNNNDVQEEVIEDTVKKTNKKAKNNFKHNKSNDKGTKFNNFTPRDYDYEDLERRLLGWDSEDGEENKKAIRGLDEQLQIG